MKKIAVIMAGGFGARLWPRSNEKCPKQFRYMLGDGTMIQNTFVRLLPLFKPEDIYVVAMESLKPLILEQLPAIPEQNIIVEPLVRNTAPCLALTAAYISSLYGEDAVIAAFPSDHMIYNIREFHNSINSACQAACQMNGIATIGLRPTRPDTGYGYVQFNEEKGDLNELYDKGVRYTVAFAEKPDKATAQRFIDSGDFLWNSGIFISRIDTFWKSFQDYLPEHYGLFKSIMNRFNEPDFSEHVKYIYSQMQSVSLDYAILEKADNVYVAQADFTWSDLGTWDEIYRLSLKDARNNVFEGDVIAVKTSNCLVKSNARMIGVVGIENLIVIDSEDALLICKKGHSSDVKEVIDFLRRKSINTLL